VDENLRTTVGCKLIGVGDTYNCGTDVIGLELDVLGKELNFRVDVGQVRARLADIVPLARTLCTKITDVVVESILSDGGNIPCCKGCAACCARYLVLACREHFVNGSAEACKGERGTTEVVEMPVQIPNALAQLAGELEGTSAEAVILPLALVWCEQNPERAERTWPAVMMVKRFFEIVKAMASKNSTAVVA